jgi:hypothetical protein
MLPVGSVWIMAVKTRGIIEIVLVSMAVCALCGDVDLGFAVWIMARLAGRPRMLSSGNCLSYGEMARCTVIRSGARLTMKNNDFGLCLGFLGVQ